MVIDIALAICPAAPGLCLAVANVQVRASISVHAMAARDSLLAERLQPIFNMSASKDRFCCSAPYQGWLDIAMPDFQQHR